MSASAETRSIIYKATVVSGEEEREYIGLTENAFKQRYANHMSTFRHEKNEKSTELAKYVWNLKRRNEQYQMKWTIFKRAPSYSNATKHCCLCLTEKLSIMEANKDTTLNCRTELVSKCRHQNKFYLSRFVPSVTSGNNYRSTYIVTRCLSSLDVLPPPAIQKLYTATISIATRQSAILLPA